SVPGALWANWVGSTGSRGKAGVICPQCHSGGDKPSVEFVPPPTPLAAGATGTFSFVVTSAAPQRQVAAGFNVAANDGTLQIVLRQGEQLSNNQLTHTQPKQNVGDQATWRFKWTAPNTPGNYILWGAGN